MRILGCAALVGAVWFISAVLPAGFPSMPSRSAETAVVSVPALPNAPLFQPSNVLAVVRAPEGVDGVWLLVRRSERRAYVCTGNSVGQEFECAVGRGADGYDATPLGEFTITEKRSPPAWHVPMAIRRRDGLAAYYPPQDPRNRLGAAWMRLGGTDYGLHGVNAETAERIGHAATSGCVAFRNDDIGVLYRLLPIGSRVRVEA